MLSLCEFIRLCGKLPLPLGSLIESIVKSGQESGLAIEHQQVVNDPLLLVSLPTDNKDQLLLESVELREGKIHLAGGRLGDSKKPRPWHLDPIEPLRPNSS